MITAALLLAGCQGVYEGAKVRDESLRTQPERVNAPPGMTYEQYEAERRKLERK